MKISGNRDTGTIEYRDTIGRELVRIFGNRDTEINKIQGYNNRTSTCEIPGKMDTEILGYRDTEIQ